MTRSASDRAALKPLDHIDIEGHSGRKVRSAFLDKGCASDPTLPPPGKLLFCILQPCDSVCLGTLILVTFAVRDDREVYGLGFVWSNGKYGGNQWLFAADVEPR